MITWRKLMGSGQMLLPNLIFIAAVRFCSYAPVCHSITPNSGEQGTDVTVTLTGDHFGISSPPWIYTQEMLANNPEFSTNFDPNNDPWNDISATFRVHIGPTAALGYHSIVLQTGSGNASIPFTVTFPGCPRPPQLLAVIPQNAAKLIPGGTVTFRFEGTNLLNNNPEVQIGGSGIHVAPSPYNVQSGGGFDYFDAEITADPTAAGAQSVYVTTSENNCVSTSNLVYITVDASQPPPRPTPGGTPSLDRITPGHISRFASQFTDVFIRFEGTGFGTSHEILVDPNSTISGFGALNEYQSDPDQVVVGFPSMNLPTGPDAFVRVRVHNLSNGIVSNLQILFLDDPALNVNAPVISANFCADFHRGDSAGNLYIEGQNLQGITEQSFSGVRGLTFSNISPTTPIYGDAQAFYVTVQADASAPISADEATNLIITTSSGPSNPFWILILPPR